MAICAPPFVKYQTKSGNCYLYDPGTEEIVLVGETIYRILDDFRVLDTGEMIEKYREIGETGVREALAQLEGLQARGILCSDTPEASIPPGEVLCRCQGNEELLGDLLRERRRVLILELTQECNLRCEYCCYGKHYPALRNHGEETMSLEAAKNAITEYIGHCPSTCSIGFYGGEPLLEFELLKQIVLFAEELAGQRGMKTEFNITTNGTLLTDEVIHFLVEHVVTVIISLDGPKEWHDRYRVFRNPKQTRGSYDVVMKNMQRFAELYPDYPARSTALTVTARSDLDAINDLLRSLRPSFRSVVVGMIRDDPGDSHHEKNGREILLGCCETPLCESGSYSRERCSPKRGNDKNYNIGELVNPSVDYMISEKLRTPPEFCNWTKERRGLFQSSSDRFMKELCREPDADVIESKFPLYCSSFRRNTQDLHRRTISTRAMKCTFPYRCVPGAVRTFCSADGVLYPCEKTETGKLFALGDTRGGVDGELALHLMETVRLLADCGNCVAKMLCPLCYAAVSQRENSGRADALAFRRECRNVIRGLPAKLKEYTTLMEMNPGIVEKMIPEIKETDDWLDSLEFLPTEEQLRDVELRIEELEELAEVI